VVATVGQVATSGSYLTRSGYRGLTIAVRERRAHPDPRLWCSIWCPLGRLPRSPTPPMGRSHSVEYPSPL